MGVGSSLSDATTKLVLQKTPVNNLETTKKIFAAGRWRTLLNN